MKNTETIEIYTDGACRGNPGCGGWGCIINNNGDKKEKRGYKAQTTNNRMELTAVIEALKSTAVDGPIVIYTDSKYVMDGINQWIVRWKKNGWMTAAKKTVKNKDLWLLLDRLICSRQINWVWVKGHAGNEGNERADYLANLAIDENNQISN
tara:strand:- start:794 stop:1249 length:456 start_codon:yes stop_codon:yes gene_type:complete